MNTAANAHHVLKSLRVARRHEARQISLTRASVADIDIGLIPASRDKVARAHIICNKPSTYHIVAFPHLGVLTAPLTVYAWHFHGP
jgi:hypothetical protein